MSNLLEEGSDYLAHFGVLGMKWGVRKENHRNPDYSANQQKRDKQIYGGRGVRRINKALNRGETISVARGTEKTKRDRVLGKNKYVRQIGKAVGVVAGVGIANLAVSKLSKLTKTSAGRAVLQKTIGTKGREFAQSAANILDTPQGRIALSGGAAYMGNLLAGDIAVAINTRSHGYDPSRKA